MQEDERCCSTADATSSRFRMHASPAAAPPPWAQGLGYAGLLPFVLLGAGGSLVDPAHRPVLLLALLGYGAVIASFLGAIHWGLLMRDASRPSPALLAWGVLPSLLAWVALLISPVAGLVLVAAVLWACYAVDRVVYPRFQVQAWLPMRLRLTCVASASCLAAALV
jgi:hypothetical protein